MKSLYNLLKYCEDSIESMRDSPGVYTQGLRDAYDKIAKKVVAEMEIIENDIVRNEFLDYLIDIGEFPEISPEKRTQIVKSFKHKKK